MALAGRRQIGTVSRTFGKRGMPKGVPTVKSPKGHLFVTFSSLKGNLQCVPLLPHPLWGLVSGSYIRQTIGCSTTLGRLLAVQTVSRALIPRN